MTLGRARQIAEENFNNAVRAWMQIEGCDYTYARFNHTARWRDDYHHRPNDAAIREAMRVSISASEAAWDQYVHEHHAIRGLKQCHCCREELTPKNQSTDRADTCATCDVVIRTAGTFDSDDFQAFRRTATGIARETKRPTFIVTTAMGTYRVLSAKDCLGMRGQLVEPNGAICTVEAGLWTMDEYNRPREETTRVSRKEQR